MSFSSSSSSANQTFINSILYKFQTTPAAQGWGHIQFEGGSVTRKINKRLSIVSHAVIFHQ